jgi:AcrB/AcrD/AcrF family protein
MSFEVPADHDDAGGSFLGALPLAVGGGVVSEFRRPLGLAIVSGLIISQMLTLYTMPVVYPYLESFRLWIEEKRGKRGTSRGTMLQFKTAW